ncbi:MAG: shikimate dehydrogenase [Gammaproteobacteria bacterium]|nr:MAG: shikimate dehydrogenase [Gammaproteobacteria bacterium]
MNTDHYLVLGNPIEHSLSPRIHSLFAQQTGQAIEYDRRLVEPGRFAETIQELQARGIKGANVTVPFKEEAFQVADQLSDAAQHAGAVNTLVFNPGGSISGHNTDGIGMVRDITINHGQTLKDKRILILGAGGAVRGILKPLIDEQPATITIANRTVSKAQALKDLFIDYYDVKVSDFAVLESDSFDLIINGTSLGLSGEVAPIPDGILAQDALAYDMMYGNGSLPFQTKVREMGAVIILDGLGMLVEQAAESFYIWRGTRPDTKSVISELR